LFSFFFFFFFFFSNFSIFPGFPAFPPHKAAYPRANKQMMPTLECYPGAKHLYIYAYVREGPTLELPWSGAPVYMRRPPTLELPWTLRATLYLPWSGLPLTRLPCTYPGAGKPAPPRLPGRLTRRTWPFSPPPPARPKAPRSPKNPPPPAYPGARPGPRPGPSRGLRTGGRPGLPGLGSRSNSHFPQK
jgi:hypothetical protein